MEARLYIAISGNSDEDIVLNGKEAEKIYKDLNANFYKSGVFRFYINNGKGTYHIPAAKIVNWYFTHVEKK